MTVDESLEPARAWRVADVAREAAVVLLFALLTIAMTWPLAPNLRTAVSDPGDPYINAWILHWDHVALLDGSRSLWDAPVFHPAKHSLAFSENLIGVALVLLPAHLAGASPITVYNLAMLAGFAFSGWGAYLLGRTLTGSRAAGIVAGIFFAFVPYRFDQISHLQHIWSGWLPVLVTGLILAARKPSVPRGGLLAVAFVMNGLTNVHWMLFGSFAIAAGAMLLALGRPRFFDRAYWSIVIGSLAVGAAILVPAMQPYREASKLYGMKRSVGEARFFSAELSDWFVAPERNRLWESRVHPERRHGERTLFPGAVVLLIAATSLCIARRDEENPEALRAVERAPRERGAALRALDVASVAVAAWWLVELVHDAELRDHARLSQLRQASLPWVLLIALITARTLLRMPDWIGGPRTLTGHLARSRFSLETWLALALVVFGVVGSLGLNAFFHEFLFSVFDVFRGLRVPARWAMIAYLGLAMLLARATFAFARRAGRWGPLVGALLAVVFLAELNAAPIRWIIAPAEPAPVHLWLAHAPFDGAIVELPMTNQGEFDAMLGATVHDRPLVNGTSGFEPPDHARVATMASADPIAPGFTRELARVRCALIVVHNEAMNVPDALRRWLREETSAGRLAFVRRFDHGSGGDWVFALPAVEPRFMQLREPERPDPSGRTPLENAAVFLDSNGRTYNSATFGVVDQPRPDSNFRGESVVSGWACAPAGIREIRILLANGRVVVPAELTDREDVRTDVYPWYPRESLRGFRAVFPKRPDGVRRKTDLQVEIIDGIRKATRLSDVWFTWTAAKPLPSFEWNDAALSALVTRLGGDPSIEVPRFHRRERSLRDVATVIVEATRNDSDPAFLERAYQILLGRSGDAAGVELYRKRLRRGYSRDDVVDAFLSSEEFRRIYEAR